MALSKSASCILCFLRTVQDLQNISLCFRSIFQSNSSMQHPCNRCRCFFTGMWVFARFNMMLHLSTEHRNYAFQRCSCSMLWYVCTIKRTFLLKIQTLRQNMMGLGQFQLFKDKLKVLLMVLPKTKGTRLKVNLA